MSGKTTEKKGVPTPKRQPRQRQKERPIGELRFSVMIGPPDGERDAENVPVPVRIDCDLRKFTLAERQLVKQIMNKLAAPIDMEDVIVAHSWVVWRRTHPESSLNVWMNHLDVGSLMDALDLDPSETAWDTTPEDYDPKPSGIT